MKKFLLFLSLSLLTFNLASAQIKHLGNRANIEEALPQFCEKYQLHDTIQKKLVSIFITHEDQCDSLRKEHLSGVERPVLSKNSTFVRAYQELQLKREADVEQLLGKKLFVKLEEFGYELAIKRREEAFKKLER